VHKLLGARYRDTVAAYASTLFRPTPEGHARGGGRLLGARISGHQVWLGRFRL
jgi:hypothetical protein